MATPSKIHQLILSLQSATNAGKLEWQPLGVRQAFTSEVGQHGSVTLSKENDVVTLDPVNPMGAQVDSIDTNWNGGADPVPDHLRNLYTTVDRQFGSDALVDRLLDALNQGS